LKKDGQVNRLVESQLSNGVSKTLREKSGFLIGYLILVGLFLIHLLPLLLPSSRTWGFNQLLFLSTGLTAAYVILAAAALIIPFLPGLSKWCEALADTLSTVLFQNRRKQYYRLLFITIMTGLFILFRAPTHFFGDGYALITNLASPAGTFVKWSEKGITLILIAIQSLLGPQNQKTALAAFQLVSVCSGTIALYFFFLIAEAISEDRMKRLLTLSVSIFSGAILLFFGYVENYPLLWPFLSGFIYCSLRYLKGRKGLTAAGILLAFGLFLHLQMGAFIPAYIYLLFCRGRGLLIYRKMRILVWSAAAVFLLAGIFLFIKTYQTDLYFENIFLPLWKGKPVAPEYTLFSLSHLADIFNLLLLLSPLLPLLLFYAGRALPGIFKDRIPLFLFLAAIGGLLFLFLIDPTLGMVRDWDLFSLSGYALTLLLVALYRPGEANFYRKVFPGMMILLALSILPFLLVNLNESISPRYARYMYELDKEKSFKTLIALRQFYIDKGDNASASELNRILRSSDLNSAKIDRAMAALDQEQVQQAREMARSINPDRYSSRYHGMMSMLYYWERNYEKALEESDQAIILQAYNFKLYSARARIFSSLGKGDSALVCLRKAYQLNAVDSDILEGFSGLYLMQGYPDSSIYYGEKLVEVDSENPMAYYFLTLASAQLGDNAKAESNFQRYLHFGNKDPLYQSHRQNLEQALARTGTH
jgi:tetratricopeptide (TPR) repeat protein